MYSRLQYIVTYVSRIISERHRQITIIWQSLPILSKILILIRWTIMIPFILALTFFILLPLVFVTPGLFLFVRWLSIFITDDSFIDIGDTKIPTFYSTSTNEGLGDTMAFIFCMPIVGVVFGGIHAQDGSSTFPPVTKLCCGGSLLRFLLVLPFYYLFLVPSWASYYCEIQKAAAFDSEMLLLQFYQSSF